MAYNGYPPANAYPPYPPQQQPYYAPPPPVAQQPVQLQPQHDPFRAYYADRLRELTFNSRPIIQDLSMIAMDQRNQHNWANMRIVVEEIEGAILRVRSNLHVQAD